MPRQLRIEYEGAIYHVMNRGDRRAAIFLADRDRELFLTTLGEACQKTGWQVHAYCLMRNHFHLVVETPQANLVAGMRWFLGTYTARFNRRQQEFGHVFSGRYKSLVVDGSGNGYLKTVCDYVHLNPVRAKLIGAEQPLSAYRWSSWGAYLKPPTQRPEWLRVDRLLGEWGIQKDHASGRRELAAGLEQRRALETAVAQGDGERVRRGWCLGRETFREELLEKLAAGGSAQRGAAQRETAALKAERMLREMLAAAGWSRADLAARLKGDKRKAQMAKRLRAETTMTWAWIAEQLAMGHWRTAANAVRKHSKARHTKSHP